MTWNNLTLIQSFHKYEYKYCFWVQLFYWSILLQKRYLYNKSSLRINYIATGLAIVIFMFSLIMLFSAFKFVKANSKSNKLPSKYGRYQRNIVTFTQSFLFNSYYQIVLGASITTILVMIHIDLSPKILFYFILICFVFLHDFIPFFILPSLLLWRLNSKLPDLFIKLPRKPRRPRKFYVRDINIFPQRDFEGNSRVKSNHKINSIEVRPAGSWNNWSRKE